jgi:hypothetical protein
MRFFYHRHLLTLAESTRANTYAIDTATERLTEGGVVNIFPTGRAVDSFSHPWRSGVGRIISELPTQAKQDVMIVPYTLGNVSVLRIIGAVAMRGEGYMRRHQTMNLHLCPLQSAAKLIESLPTPDQGDPSAITAYIKRQFIDTLHTPT